MTDIERRNIRSYLRQNGAKEVAIRKLVYGTKKHLPTIKADLELLEKLLATYSK